MKELRQNSHTITDISYVWANYILNIWDREREREKRPCLALVADSEDGGPCEAVLLWSVGEVWQSK